MSTVIFRTMAPVLSAVMLLYSVFVLLRGHDEPGGGFIGGLIAASAIAIYAIALGVKNARRALVVDPIVFAGLGLFVAGLSGMVSLGAGMPFLTGLWSRLPFGEAEIVLSTPLLFDIGVYLVVVGTLSSVALALENGEGEEG